MPLPEGAVEGARFAIAQRSRKAFDTQGAIRKIIPPHASTQVVLDRRVAVQRRKYLASNPAGGSRIGRLRQAQASRSGDERGRVAFVHDAVQQSQLLADDRRVDGDARMAPSGKRSASASKASALPVIFMLASPVVFISRFAILSLSRDHIEQRLPPLSRPAREPGAAHQWRKTRWRIDRPCLGTGP